MNKADSHSLELTAPLARMCRPSRFQCIVLAVIIIPCSIEQTNDIEFMHYFEHVVLADIEACGILHSTRNYKQMQAKNTA